MPHEVADGQAGTVLSLTCDDQLVVDGLATGWVGGVYEPETQAFGGPDGMGIAHKVLCADSRAALVETDTPHSKERCVLLLSAMSRAAGLDPFEIGDVWAKVADLRPAIEPRPGTTALRPSPPCGAL